MRRVTFLHRHTISSYTSRTAIEDEIDRLLSILDGVDADPDLEPSIGWSANNGGGVSEGQIGSPADDREDDAGDDGEMDDDREWSLGWIEMEDQHSILHGHSGGDLEAGGWRHEYAPPMQYLRLDGEIRDRDHEGRFHHLAGDRGGARPMTTIPVGGSTGCDHQDNRKVEEAGRWLASIPRAVRPHPIVPALRERFGLTAVEACAAIREATLAHGRAL